MNLKITDILELSDTKLKEGAVLTLDVIVLDNSNIRLMMLDETTNKVALDIVMSLEMFEDLVDKLHDVRENIRSRLDETTPTDDDGDSD